MVFVFLNLVDVFLLRLYCIWGLFGDGIFTDKGIGEEVLIFIGFMGFANFFRLERNRFFVLFFVGIFFRLWVVLGLFGGFYDGSVFFDNLVVGLKKLDIGKEWIGLFGLVIDLFDVCIELLEDLDGNLIGGVVGLLNVGIEIVEFVGIGFFGFGFLLIDFVSEL